MQQDIEVCFAVPHPRVTSYIVTTPRNAPFVVCFAVHIPLEQMGVMAKCWFELVCQLESEPRCVQSVVGHAYRVSSVWYIWHCCWWTLQELMLYYLFVCHYHSIQYLNLR